MAKTRAELWEEFRPLLSDARKKDRQEAAVLLLPITVRAGRFWFAPMTLRRILVLESLQSPFLTGARMPTRKDILRFLWIMSPGFKLTRLRFSLFHARHFFIIWPKYIRVICELMGEAMEMMGDTGKEEGEPSSMWAASMIDGAASQYGWRYDEILDMPLATSILLAKALGARLSMDSTPVTFARHADKVRADYLKKTSELFTPKKENGERN